jgi:GxxExxY protein
METQRDETQRDGTQRHEDTEDGYTEAPEARRLEQFGTLRATRHHAAMCGRRVAGSGGMLIDTPRINSLTGEILGAAIEVHRELGPGLLESAYAPCLEYELAARGLRFISQSRLPISYKTIALQCGYRVDLIVEDAVIVEIKAVDALAPVHQAQVLTYLRLTGCLVGLLVNFNTPRLMDGVRRLVNSRT